MRKHRLLTLALVVAAFVANAMNGSISGPTSVCPGDTDVTYYATGSGGGIGNGRTAWRLNGQPIFGNAYSADVDFPTAGTYTLTAINVAAGINASLTIVAGSSNPGSLALSSGTCNAGNVTLDASGYSGNLRWQRRVGAGNWADYAPGFIEPLGETLLTVGTQYQYRVRTNDNTCAVQYSNIVTFTPKNPVSAGTASGNQTICSSQTPSSTITASSASGGAGSYSYSWEKKPVSGGSWTNIGGGSSLSPSEVGTLTQSTKFRRKVTDSECGTVYSNEVTVTIASNLSAGSIGNAQTVCYNGNPSALTNTASASGATGTLSYLWQYSTNGSSGWTDLIGEINATYNPPNLTSNRWYRRRASRCNQTVYSNSIKITVRPALVAGSISNAQTLCHNENPAALTNTASASGGDGNIDYLWQYSLNGTSGWTNMPAHTNATYDPDALTTTTWYRRRAVSCGQTLYTNSVKITIHDDLLPGKVNGNQSICYNTAPTELTNFTSASGGGSGLSYQWQESTDGVSYANISATGASYQPGILTSDRWYRRGAYSNDCAIEYTLPVKVTVDAQTNGGSLIESSFNNTNVEVFSSTDVNLSLSGEVGNIIQWQYKTTGGWQNIVNTTDTHSEINVTVPTYYRAEVKNGTCATGYSNEVFVNVFPNPNFDFGIRTSVRPGSGTTVSVDAGYANYQWYKDDVSIPNNNSNELLVTHPGKYRVTITSTLGATFSTGNATITNQLEEDNTYVMVYDFREQGYRDTDDLFGIPMADMSITADVYDGLGRPIQKINMEGSPDGDDLVAPVEYDDFGREQKSYLPYVSSDLGQLYKPNALGVSSEQKTFYELEFSSNDKAFSENKFEASPLNRVVEQGLPGESWGIGSQHSVKMSYQVNLLTDAVKKWSMNGDLPQDDGDYADGRLFKNTTTDENGAQTITFTNFRQDPILIRKQINASDWTETYYIYDQRNRLRVVLQPEGVKNLAQYTGTTQQKEDFLAAWAFQYGYDPENRQIWKQVPGAGRMYTVYDAWDRVRMTQDGNQADGSEWAFIKYDALNRPIMTGIQSNLNNHASVTTTLTSDTDQFETYSASTHTYSDNMYPSVATSVELHTVTFYDTYDILLHSEWTGLNLGFSEPAPARTPMTQPSGQVTATKTKVSNGSWIYSTSHYDDLGRVIQTRSTNHLGGVDVVTNYYNFANEVTKTITEHGDGSTTTTITRDLEYDHRGRLLRTWHKINDEPAVLLAENEYNELDEVAEKRLHSTDGTGFEQYMDYEYNIRRWLTSINDSGLSSIGDPVGDLFGMELAYEQALTGLSGSTDQFNGNISAMRWSDATGSTSDTRAYIYSYDKLSRLTAADHYKNNAGTNNFDVSGVGYDDNGNILSLTRKNDSGTDMDNLTYSYGTQGNRLMAVADAGSDSTGFVDGTNLGDDYTYDANGNMISDANKGITSIEYNHLNLPLTVILSASGGSQDSIKYLYDAAGIKLQQSVYDSGVLVKTTDYVGEFIYETDTSGSRALQLIQHEEGRVVTETQTGEPIIELNGNSTSGFEPLLDVSISSNGTHVQVTTNQSSSTPGATFGNYATEDGQQFTLSVKGYASPGSGAYLYAKANSSGHLVWLSQQMPEGSSNESWISETFTVPAGNGNVTIGVLFDGNPAIGETFYISDVRLESPEHTSNATGEIVFSKDGSNTVDIDPLLNVTITSDGSMITVTNNQGSSTPGFLYKNIQLEADKEYTLSVNGYSEDPAEAYLYVKSPSGGNLVWLNERLMIGSSNQKWVSSTFTTPAGNGTVDVGVLFKPNSTTGSKFHVDDLQISKSVAALEYDYQYHLKDHLGNTRVTFSTTPENYETVQNMESLGNNMTDPEEETMFVNIPYRIDANASTSGNEVATLKPDSTGVMIFFEVNRGDTVNFSVQANYVEQTSTTYNLANIAGSAILSGYNNAVDPLNELPTALSGGVNDGVDAMLNTNSLTKNSTNDAPLAYINYLYFNKDMTLHKAGFSQISTAARGLNAHELVTLNVGNSAEIDGFILAYLSNETQQAIDVNFDDFTVYHGKTNVVQSDDYYPYGLTFNSSQRVASTLNNFKYNGKELDENTQWYDYGARMYQADLGRWFAVDPLGEKFMDMTTYKYAMNNPISFIDPDGMAEIQVGYGMTADGNNTGAVTHYDFAGGNLGVGNATWKANNPIDGNSNSNNNDNNSNQVVAPTECTGENCQNISGYVAEEWEGEILNNIYNENDTRNVDGLESLNPAFAKMVKELIVRARIEFGYNLVITTAYRSAEEQNELYEIGRGTVEFGNVAGFNIQLSVPDSRRKVTSAKGYESYHQYGFAVDIVNIASKTSFNYNHTYDKSFMNMAKEIGLVSGTTFGDRPHFQQSFGQHWSELKKKAGK